MRLLTYLLGDSDLDDTVPVVSHFTPIGAYAAAIGEEDRIDDDIADLFDKEGRLRTFVHLGKADTVVVCRSSCHFAGRPSRAKSSHKTAPITCTLLIECRGMDTSSVDSADLEIDVADYFHAPYAGSGFRNSLRA